VFATTLPQNPSRVNRYMTATDVSGFTWDEALPVLQAQFAPLPSQQPHLTDSCNGTAMTLAQQQYPLAPAPACCNEPPSAPACCNEPPSAPGDVALVHQQPGVLPDNPLSRASQTSQQGDSPICTIFVLLLMKQRPDLDTCWVSAFSSPQGVMGRFTCKICKHMLAANNCLPVTTAQGCLSKRVLCMTPCRPWADRRATPARARCTHPDMVLVHGPNTSLTSPQVVTRSS